MIQTYGTRKRGGEKNNEVFSLLIKQKKASNLFKYWVASQQEGRRAVVGGGDIIKFNLSKWKDWQIAWKKDDINIHYSFIIQFVELYDCFFSCCCSPLEKVANFLIMNVVDVGVSVERVLVKNFLCALLLCLG